jgi:hypothetical protein
MKNVIVYRQDNQVKINVSLDVSNNRKSQLRVNTKQVENKFNDILLKMKKFSKFQHLSVSYQEQDYYDNMVDVYETPYIHFTKGKRKTVISSQEHGCIPKDWTEEFLLILEDPKTIKPIEDFLLEFNIILTNKEITALRKSIKGIGSFDANR